VLGGCESVQDSEQDPELFAGKSAHNMHRTAAEKTRKDLRLIQDSNLKIS